MGWIVIVEDEEGPGRRLFHMLEKRNLRVKVCDSFASAIGVVDRLVAQKEMDVDKTINNIDVMIVDLNLSSGRNSVIGEDGIAVMQHMKNVSPDSYVLIYTAQDVYYIACNCWKLADDFFQKTTAPGHMHAKKVTHEELVEHVIHYLREHRLDQEVLMDGVFYNFTLRTLVVNGNMINLTEVEKEVIRTLFNHIGYFVTYEEIQSILNENGMAVRFSFSPRSIISDVDSFMKKLIRKTGKNLIVHDSTTGYGIAKQEYYRRLSEQKSGYYKY